MPLGHLRLLLERLELAAELGQHVLQAQEILVQPRQLALGPLLAATVLGDAGRLLDVPAPVLRAGLQDLLELALADDRVQRAADARLAQQLLDVEEAHDLAADPVLALARAEDRPAHLDLRHGHGDHAGRVVDHELHLGHAEGGAGRGSGEDHVGHLAAAERAGALFTEHPADRVHEVRLAGSVRTHDHGDAGGELENGLVRERLEAADRERAKEHPGAMLTAAVRGTGRRGPESGSADDPEPVLAGQGLGDHLDPLDVRAARAVLAPGRRARRRRHRALRTRPPRGRRSRCGSSRRPRAGAPPPRTRRGRTRPAPGRRRSRAPASRRHHATSLERTSGRPDTLAACPHTTSAPR